MLDHVEEGQKEKWQTPHQCLCCSVCWTAAPSTSLALILLWGLKWLDSSPAVFVLPEPTLLEEAQTFLCARGSHLCLTRKSRGFHYPTCICPWVTGTLDSHCDVACWVISGDLENCSETAHHCGKLRLVIRTKKLFWHRSQQKKDS